jgi:phosphoribosylamine--glycine ligase
MTNEVDEYIAQVIGKGDEGCQNVSFDVTAGKTTEDRQKNFPGLADVVESLSIDSIVVGPEQPLVDGVVDFFYERGFRNIFGPTKAGAQIEADKFFSYDVMEAAGVSQARSVKCDTLEQAIKAIRENAIEDVGSGDFGIVLKAKGLTGGKGVSVYNTPKQALSDVETFMTTYKGPILVAERLFGQEVSVFGISDGNRVIPLEMSVQDHKRLLENDQGPNTGGMGAYGPAPVADKDMVWRVANTMMTPVVQEMKRRGIIYTGFLYAGVMMTEEGPKILEFNCRFGDPEAQPSVMMLKDGLYQPIKAALEGRLQDSDFKFKEGAAITFVLASNGYPGHYDKGLKIAIPSGLSGISGLKIFHAGTALKDGALVTSGGRVLEPTYYAPEGLATAQELCRQFTGMIASATSQVNDGREVFVYRKDIGAKGLA